MILEASLAYGISLCLQKFLNVFICQGLRRNGHGLSYFVIGTGRCTADVVLFRCWLDRSALCSHDHGPCLSPWCGAITKNLKAKNWASSKAKELI